jgi:hypothetical protein
MIMKAMLMGWNYGARRAMEGPGPRFPTGVVGFGYGWEEDGLDSGRTRQVMRTLGMKPTYIVWSTPDSMMR